MLATGAACSVGDQMHPRGRLEATAYARLGEVYAQVEALEPWTTDAEPVQEIGVLLAETGPRFHVVGRDVDEGAMRMLMELHRPFQFLDAAADFTPYRVLIAPDDVPFTADLAAKVTRYLHDGGALLLAHRAGLTPEGDRFALDQERFFSLAFFAALWHGRYARSSSTIALVTTISSSSQTLTTCGPISSPARLSWWVSSDNAAVCTTSSTSSLRPWPWRRPPSWPWSGGGPAPAQCGAQHRAWQQCGSSMPMPPGGRTVRVNAICRLADARRRAGVLLYLQRVDHARCRGCCEAQPVRGSTPQRMRV
jgi:hypothetical protein